MGGDAFLILGTFDPERAAASATPTLIDRLLGRKARATSTMTLPGGRAMLEFPARALEKPLARDYLAFVRGRLPDPSASSHVVLQYLGLGQPSIYLRADRAAGESDGPWYVQVSFSGAAGMAETSARVAAHWAAHWYAARSGPIGQSILLPAGFVATGAESPMDAVFVPAGECGYAERENGTFTIDAAFLESHEDPDALLKDLERQYGRDLNERVCRCQLCSPPR